MSHSLSRRVLLVADEQPLLDSFKRTHRKSFDLQVANGGQAALDLLRSQEAFAVVVSDYQMPHMDGVTFLARVCDAYPEVIRVMLAGNADLQSAIEAVNTGRIFRFLTKPCKSDVFASCLEMALEQYELRHSERLLLAQTVQGSLEVLADVLAMASPDAFGRSKRVKTYVSQVVKALKLSSPWKYETAALLSQVGFASVPLDIIEKIARGEKLSAEYAEVIDRHPSVARNLLVKIPRMEPVANMIANQRIRYNERGKSDLTGDILTGAQVLAACLDFDELISLGAKQADAVTSMQKRAGYYDPMLLKTLNKIDLPGQEATTQALRVNALRVGMVLDQDVRSKGGPMVVAKGNTISRGMLARLRNYARLGGISEPIRVLVPSLAAKHRERAA